MRPSELFEALRLSASLLLWPRSWRTWRKTLPVAHFGPQRSELPRTSHKRRSGLPVSSGSMPPLQIAFSAILILSERGLLPFAVGRPAIAPRQRQNTYGTSPQRRTEP